MEELIKSFLTIGDGYGYGSGSGSGSGSGYVYGSGDGYGYGSGSGSGYGYGYGYGDGDGYGYGDGSGSGSGSGSLLSIKKVGDDNIYNIDEIPTAIDNIKGNVAQGRILKADITWEPCYIVRIGNIFAHGETVHDAKRDAMHKHMSDAPEEERLKMFTDKFPTLDTVVTAKEFDIAAKGITGGKVTIPVTTVEFMSDKIIELNECSEDASKSIETIKPWKN